MKKSKILIPLLVVAAALITFAVLSLSKPTPLRLVSKMLKKLEGVSSIKTETTFDVDGTISTELFSGDIGFDGAFDTEGVMDTGVNHATGTVTVGPIPLLGDLDIPIEIYQQAKDGTAVSYTNIYGTGWIKSEGEQETPDDINLELDEKTLLGILQKIKSGEIKADLAEETQKLGEQECYKIDIFIAGDLLGDLVKAAAEAEGEASQLPDDFDLKGGDAYITLYIGKETKLPARADIDCSALGNVLVQKFADDGDVAITANKCLISVVFTEFNTIDELQIPDDVVSSAKTSEEFNIFDSIMGK